MQRDKNFKPQLYDGEVILLVGFNRALQSVNIALEKIKTVENWINSSERSKANYIDALKRRLSILQKSDFVLKMTLISDRTSKNTRSHKQKDKELPSRIKKSEQLKKTLIETFQPVTERSQAPSRSYGTHDWPTRTACARSAKISNKGFCSTENVFSDNDSSVLRAALATETSHTNDEDTSLSRLKLDVTDAESLLFAKKPLVLDCNRGSDY